jgi:hypothetical protein
MEVALEQGDGSDREDQFEGSGDSETASDNYDRMQIGAEAALALMRYDFGQSTIMKARHASQESIARYFLEGHGRPLGVESLPNPRENEAMVFEDVFVAGLCMHPHLVLVHILHKFQVQLHQLIPNAIIQISKFIWAITSYG